MAVGSCGEVGSIVVMWEMRFFLLFGFGLGFQFVGVVGGRGGGLGFAGSGSGGSYEFARL